ncbi:hypothetical protein BCR34DRAFT_605672 [Clohesyomyces aquaticus]|uniref:Uncharacterized protein n=1 Tax=Clohesyomyces aquaticus TaxID=1231657 RepID=A0A1Y1YWH1_9PLEO|nr:hypothetical protein BCR34DRAFT_605672 [Clohesyomyces aquaticus]
MVLLASTLTTPGFADSGEIVYLCHCGQAGGGAGDAVYSTMVYYKNASNSNAGQQFDAIPKEGHFQDGSSHWEGSITSATFPDGNVFTGTIKAGAGSVPT